MKAPNAWQQAFKQAKGRYGDLLAGFLLHIAIRLLALCPLMTLLVPSGSGLKYLALLAPILWIMLVWPLRFSMAEAMADFSAGGKLCTPKLVSLDRYGEKLKHSLLHALLALVWALPLLAALAYLYFAFMGGGEMDAFTALRYLGSIGSFIGGSFLEGILLLILGIILLALPMFYSLCRLSANRHLWAMGASVASLNGSRLKQLGLGLINSLLLLPCLLFWAGWCWTSSTCFWIPSACPI
ncbi:MAG: hypothetical protein IJ461_03175 [Clostridia bacterium]|nr:hypothetical protein [Clostridia bacterium]